MTLPRLLCRLLHRRSWTINRLPGVRWLHPDFAAPHYRAIYHCPLCDRTWVKREGTLR